MLNSIAASCVLLVLLVYIFKPTAQTFFLAVQTIFAGLLLVFIYRQTGIMKNQTNITSRQTEIMEDQNIINGRNSLLAQAQINLNNLVINFQMIEKWKQRTDVSKEKKEKEIKCILADNQTLHETNTKIEKLLNSKYQLPPTKNAP